MSVELGRLDSLRVRASFRVRTSTLDIRSRTGELVARLRKEGAVRDRIAYDLLTGADPGTPAGRITASGALDVDGSPLGIVNLTAGSVPDDEVHPLKGGPIALVAANPASWGVVQPGLPRLSGRPRGLATRLVFNRFTRALGNFGFDTWIADYVLPMRFTYSGRDCAGFTITRHRGRARFTLVIHDPRVDRRVALAALVALIQFVLVSPGTDAVTLLRLFRRRRRPR
ncbi:MAG: hypothetical protein ACJ73S_10395 [Mycobacteriales bacterium]